MSAIEEINAALDTALLRVEAAPNLDVYVSAVAQLEYLSAVLTGKEKDRSRLKEIILGHFAVREFAESDPDFAQHLHQAQLIASKMASGLKVN